ncbi:MAG: hypothetical protein E6G35_11740 [Actinobacteria bacterium]|nr:MAG: hypothetical protein E6G35_11740 [Actinomycetota bacterium]
MTSRHDQDPGVRLQVHELVTAGLRRLTATVRCLQGPTRLHAHFHRINQAIAIDLDLIGIEVYGSPVDQLDPVWTARVTMTGNGADLIQAGDIIHGTNPREANPQPLIHNS